MPVSRELVRNQRLSTRAASKAVKTALGELTAPSRARVRVRGLTTSRVVAKPSDALAFATTPAITFSTTKDRKLETPRQDITAVARHEVAHFSLPGSGDLFTAGSSQTSRQHFNVQAASTGGGTLPRSGTQLRQASNAARLTFEQQAGRVRKLRAANRQSSISTTVRPGSLRAAHHSPSEKRRKDARVLSNRMQFRLRKAGRDF